MNEKTLMRFTKPSVEPHTRYTSMIAPFAVIFPGFRPYLCATDSKVLIRVPTDIDDALLRFRRQGKTPPVQDIVDWKFPCYCECQPWPPAEYTALSNGEKTIKVGPVTISEAIDKKLRILPGLRFFAVSPDPGKPLAIRFEGGDGLVMGLP